MDTIAIPVLNRPVDTTVEIPDSKSITNRALLVADLDYYFFYSARAKRPATANSTVSVKTDICCHRLKGSRHCNKRSWLYSENFSRLLYSIFPDVRTIKGELQCQIFEKECQYLPVMKEIG